MTKRHKKQKNQLVIIIILIVLCLGLYYLIFKKEKTSVIDSIDKYEYKLDKNDSKYMKEVYNELKNELSKNDINYENYASLIAKLFIIDLYTIDTKENLYDVGGIEYIIPSSQENFKLKVQNTLYNHLKDKNQREEKFPVVSNVEIKSSESKDNKYIIELNWQYEEDLGYDNSGVVSLEKKDNKVYITSFKGGN